MIIVKLGGSLITDKAKPLVAREDVIRRVCEELKTAYPNMIITHGTGSFGHPLALRYRIHKGFHGKEEERIGISETKYWVNNLTQMVLRALLDAGIPAFPFHPSSLGVMEDGKFVEFNFEPIRGYLKMGIIPVIPADGPYDRKKGALIASGDYLAEVLAREFKPSMVIFAMDEDGIMFEGNVIRELTLKQLEEFLEKIQVGEDATGGLKGKLKHVVNILRLGIPVKLVNGLVNGRLKNLLEGKNPIHTNLKP